MAWRESAAVHVIESLGVLTLPSSHSETGLHPIKNGTPSQRMLNRHKVLMV